VIDSFSGKPYFSRQYTYEFGEAPDFALLAGFFAAITSLCEELSKGQVITDIGIGHNYRLFFEHIMESSLIVIVGTHEEKPDIRGTQQVFCEQLTKGVGAMFIKQTEKGLKEGEMPSLDAVEKFQRGLDILMGTESQPVPSRLDILFRRFREQSFTSRDLMREVWKSIITDEGVSH